MGPVECSAGLVRSVVRAYAGNMSQPAFYPTLPTTFVTDSRGFLITPFSLEVEVLTDAGDEAMVRTSVAIGGDYPMGDRLGEGYFRAGSYDPHAEDWGPDPLDDPGPGRRTVRWFAVLEDGGPEVTWTTRTERLQGGPLPNYGVPYYALISDLRAESFAPGVLSDSRAATLLSLASRYIEAFTGRRFVAEPKELHLSGSGSARLQFSEPIVGIEVDGVSVDLGGAVISTSLPYSRENLRIYSRHLTERLTQPDDRQNPKIESYLPIGIAYRAWNSRHLSAYAFPEGSQNIAVRGVFGFTEPDGSPMGCTPMLIRHAAMLLVRRHMLGGGIGAGGGAGGGVVTQEKTRDQSVSYAAPGSIGSGRAGSPLLGAFTGDPEIDTILAMFMRQVSLGAV